MSVYVLRLSCADRPGIVAHVSGVLFHAGGNIVEAQQFNDVQTGNFFMRVVFEFGGDASAIREIIRPLATPGDGGVFSLRCLADKPRVLLLVSKFDHCLVDLLYRWRINELPMDLIGLISNHPESALNLSDAHDVPFHYVPVGAGGKKEQEDRIMGVVEETGAEVVALARYMQILSDDLARRLYGRCINIHHSFLPGFKGAKPYHQAHARGVKMIGATAHYVTADLDEGPIIAQDVEAVTHNDTPEDLVRKGRDIERRVLARALHYHLEDRVFLNGNKTIVFRD